MMSTASSEYISLSEAASITGFDSKTILKWCRGHHVRSISKGSDNQDRIRPNISSLFAYIDELAMANRPGKVAVIQPRKLDQDIDRCMTPDQLQAHRLLMDHPEMIECQRGARMLESACKTYVRKNYGLARTVGCIGCERFQKPAVVPKGEDKKQGFQTVNPIMWDVRADIRDFHHQAPQLFAAAETKERKAKAKPKEKRGDAAKRISKERMAAAKEKLQQAHERRMLMRRAKRLYKDGYGKTYREIAKILGISKTTAERYVTGKEFR